MIQEASSNASVRRVVAVHGNPGAPADFSAVVRQLEARRAPVCLHYYRCVEDASSTAVPSFEDMLVGMDQAAAFAGQQDLELDGVAFSYGAYLALTWAQVRGRRWRRLVLINPTLAVDKALPPWLRRLLFMPGLGSALLAMMAPKLAAGFIRRCFAPQPPPAAEEERLRAFLAVGRVWRRALAAKLIQEDRPLAGDLGALADEFIIVRGEQDQAVTWQTQRALLSDALAARVHSLPDAGHAILWTAPELVADLICGEGPRAL